MFTIPKGSPFITPSAPVQKREPPAGPEWIHEVKFDGWRGQLHKSGDDVAIFSRNGKNLTNRFKAIRDSVFALPVRSIIIDAEIVVCDTDGRPDFNAVMQKTAGELCAWCFDLLALNGRPFRDKPLIERKARLRSILITADDHRLRYSDEFSDAEKLLAVADREGLEGIVSKRKDQTYCSGKNHGWVKVKCPSWREANRSRSELFHKRIT